MTGYPPAWYHFSRLSRQGKSGKSLFLSVLCTISCRAMLYNDAEITTKSMKKQQELFFITRCNQCSSVSVERIFLAASTAADYANRSTSLTGPRVVRTCFCCKGKRWRVRITSSVVACSMCSISSSMVTKRPCVSQ
jgi:hypothetical protein